MRITAPLESLAHIAEEVAHAQTARHNGELRRIEAMRAYADNLSCRRAYLLAYFGEDASPNCGNCDNCQGEGTERAQVIADARTRVVQESA